MAKNFLTKGDLRSSCSSMRRRLVRQEKCCSVCKNLNLHDSKIQLQRSTAQIKDNASRCKLCQFVTFCLAKSRPPFDKDMGPAITLFTNSPDQLFTMSFLDGPALISIYEDKGTSSLFVQLSSDHYTSQCLPNVHTYNFAPQHTPLRKKRQDISLRKTRISETCLSAETGQQGIHLQTQQMD